MTKSQSEFLSALDDAVFEFLDSEQSRITWGDDVFKNEIAARNHTFRKMLIPFYALEVNGSFIRTDKTPYDALDNFILSCEGATLGKRPGAKIVLYKVPENSNEGIVCALAQIAADGNPLALFINLP